MLTLPSFLSKRPLKLSSKRSANTALLLGFLFVSPLSFADKLSDLPTAAYALDKNHASIVWKVSHFGLSNYVARFTDFDATLNLDTDDFSKSTVKAVIKADSIRTEYTEPQKKDFDNTLSTGKGWFNSAKFPDITFESGTITGFDGKNATVNGTLTLLGVSKPAVMQLTLNKALEFHPFAGRPALGFSASLTLQRSDWGLKKFVPKVGNDVQIDIEAEFIVIEED